MVMSILAAICAGGQMIYDSVAASNYAIYCNDIYGLQYDSYYDYSAYGICRNVSLANIRDFAFSVFERTKRQPCEICTAIQRFSNEVTNCPNT